MRWLLAWLIVNALFFVWRILVTTEVETPDSRAHGAGREPWPSESEADFHARRMLDLHEPS
jgi:hypothetical protein